MSAVTEASENIIVQESCPQAGFQNRHAIQMGLFLALNAALVLLAIIYFDKWDSFVGIIGRVNASIILIIGGLACANYVLRAVRYKLLNDKLNVRIPFTSTLLFYVAGFSFAVTPGRVGELIRTWMIRKVYNYPVRQSSPAVFVDRLGDLLATLVLCLCTLSLFADHLVPVLAAGILIVAGVFLLTRPDWMCEAIGFVSRLLPKRMRLFAMMRRIVRGISKLLRPGVMASTLAVGILAWLCESVAFWAALHFLGGDISFTSSVFVFAFANLIGALTFLPGGIGGTELTMITLLTALNVPAEIAISTTVLIRTMTLWFGVLLGLTTSIYLSGRLKSSVELAPRG